MNYLELNRGELALLFIQDPNALVNAIEAWCFQYYFSEIFDDDFPVLDLEYSLNEMNDAIQLARVHSPDIKRFCEDISAGRAPSLELGSRLLYEPNRANELDIWQGELERYIDLYRESLGIASVLSQHEEPNSLGNSHAVDSDEMPRPRKNCRGESGLSQLPHWDSISGRLTIGNYERAFRANATAVKPFLDLFQANDWANLVQAPTKGPPLDRALRTFREDPTIPISFHVNDRSFEWRWKAAETTCELPSNRSRTADE